jgi:hypothetical protein
VQFPTSQLIVVFGGGDGQHAAPQRSLSLLQVGMHALLTQCRVPPGRSAQTALVQAPQWSGSLEMSTQVPPQFVCVGPQQTPLLQLVPLVQACPQVPQFWLSAW